MTSQLRNGHFRLLYPTSMRGFGPNRESVELGLPPRRLLDQLLADMQSHLDEMERMRVVVADAYPQLSDRSEYRSPRARSGLLAVDRDEHDASHYRFSLDVSGFAADELTAKLDGRRLTLCGKTTKRTEAPDGCVSHEFREVRKEILLPEDAQLDALACNFIPETGRLLVEAPRLAPLPADGTPIPIPIQREPARVSPGGHPTGKEAGPEKKGAAASS